MPPTVAPFLRHPAAVVSVLFLLLAVTWLCYRPGLEGPFLLDDGVNIPQAELPQLSLSAINETLFKDPTSHPFFRSIGRLSFSLTLHFSGFDPQAFKYQNLMLHLINGLLVFWLIHLLAAERNQERYDARVPWFALAVAAVWLLHPLQVSTVLYAVQRLTLLSSLFVLLGLISYTKGRILSGERPAAGSAVALGGVLGFGLLGLTSKQNAALLPVYVAAIEFFVFRFVFAKKWQRQLFRFLLVGIVVVPVAAALLYWTTLLPVLDQAYQARDFDLPQRVMTQMHVLLMYMRLFFIPIPGEMSLFHDDFPVRRMLDAATIGLALLYAALIASAFRIRAGLPFTALGIAWFFISHLMESTILPLELVFEHRNYLALVGLALVSVDLLRRLAQTPLLRRLLPLVLASVLLMLGLNTAARAFAWSDLRLMLVTEYEHRPGSARVVGYLAEMNFKGGNTELAQRFVDELLALSRRDAGAEVMNIRVRCNEAEVSDRAFEQARDKLANGTLTAFSFEALSRLTRDFASGECPAITLKQADDLLRAAVDNPRRASINMPCLIEHMRTKLFTSEGQWADVPGVLSGTIERCGSPSKTLLRFMVTDWMTFALDVGGAERVIKVLNALPEEQSAAVGESLPQGRYVHPSRP